MQGQFKSSQKGGHDSHFPNTDGNMDEGEVQMMQHNLCPMSPDAPTAAGESVVLPTVAPTDQLKRNPEVTTLSTLRESSRLKQQKVSSTF